MELQINPRHIAAALHLTADANDVRYYLRDIRIDGPVVTATNGSALILLRDSTQGEGSLILPKAIALQLAKSKAPKVTISSEDGKVWKAPLLGVSFTATDAQWPDLRRVIPATVSGVAGQFDPDMLILFAKAAKSLGTKAPIYLHHNGLRESALVSLVAFPDFLGVIMPWCSQATFKAPPLPSVP